MGIFAHFLIPYSELDYHLAAVNALKAIEDPSKEPFEIKFRDKWCILAKVHEDEKARKFVEKGVESLNEEFDIFKILANIKKAQPVKEEEEGGKKEGKDKKE